MPTPSTEQSRTNSHQPPSLSSPRFEVVEVGVDTVSLAWRPDDPQIWEFLRQAARAKELTAGDPFAMPVAGPGEAAPRIGLYPEYSNTGRATGAYRTKGHIAGVPWTFNCAKRIIYCEGRLICILEDDESAVGLPAPAMLEHAAFLATFLLAQFGVRLVPDDAVVRRCDITGRVRFPNAKDGRDLQRALRDHADESPKSHGTGPVTETVSWTDGRGRIDFTSYDEGVSRETYAPGQMIRLERRHRLDKPRQISVPEFLRQDLGSIWLDTFDRRTAAVPPLGTRDDAQAIIAQHVSDGKLSLQTSNRLQGSIANLEGGGYALWGPAKLSQDHRRRLVRQLEDWGVATVASERRRGGPWQAAAYCRPAGSVIRVADVSSALREAMSDLQTTERPDPTASPERPRSLDSASCAGHREAPSDQRSA